MFNIITNKLLSILFRIVLILFGMIVISIKDNIFPIYFYLLALIPYIIIYRYTLFGDGLASKFRMINDFSLIVFILYGKELDFLNYGFLLLPILNSANHSGEKKSWLLYAILIATIYILTKSILLEHILAISIFWIINFLIDSKQRYFKNISNLNEQIELFFDKDLELRKSYKIYDGVIYTLNKIKLLLVYSPKFENIICFRVDYLGKLKLVNSSSFLWSYNVDSRKLHSIMRMKSPSKRNSNIEFEFNKKKSSKNFVIYKKNNLNNYIYILQLKEDFNSSDLLNLYYIHILNPIFSRISRVLDLEVSIKEQNKKILNDFRDKYFYVQNAEKAMHFLKNRFNTLDNFIEMSKDNIAGKMDEEDMLLYEEELNKVEHNYGLLIQRAKNILKKSDKPYSATKLETKSANFLFEVIRSTWLDYFNDFNMELGWDVEKIDLYEIELNNDGLYILLNDWIANMNNYSAGDEKIIFEESLDDINITFSNRYRHSDETIIQELIRDFNSKEKDKILKRTSHGVLIIKSLIEEMCIKSKLSSHDNKLMFTLIFKKIPL